ncbi:hypothetical protein chiPu_0030583, partial [Chiloscyllium punctatum]|nr:hypothetical protein [Chiloscyllium punctatum]
MDQAAQQAAMDDDIAEPEARDRLGEGERHQRGVARMQHGVVSCDRYRRRTRVAADRGGVARGTGIAGVVGVARGRDPDRARQDIVDIRRESRGVDVVARHVESDMDQIAQHTAGDDGIAEREACDMFGEGESDKRALAGQHPARARRDRHRRSLGIAGEIEDAARRA